MIQWVIAPITTETRISAARSTSSPAGTPPRPCSSSRAKSACIERELGARLAGARRAQHGDQHAAGQVGRAPHQFAAAVGESVQALDARNRPLELFVDEAAEAREDVLPHFAQHVLLAGEMVEERRGRDVGGHGDLLDGGRVVAVAREEFGRGGEDGLVQLAAAAAAAPLGGRGVLGSGHFGLGDHRVPPNLEKLHR